MTGLLITCDRSGGLIRAAVWSGKDLRDLYVDRIDAPDLSGAVVRGKVVRVLAGQKAGWIDCGLAERVYVESARTLAAGEMKTVFIKSTLKQSKAWRGTLLAASGKDEQTGVIKPPPAPWLRALIDIGEERPVTLRFSDPRDYEAFQAETDVHADVKVEFSKEPVHPELDEILSGLLERRVELPGGANIVIERTEAMIVIDVNAGEGGGNPAAINILAAREAARQVRLRNLGGIIVIDALKMHNRTEASKLLNALTRVTESDPAGAQVFGISKLGLVEMTRKRRGPALEDLVEKA